MNPAPRLVLTLSILCSLPASAFAAWPHDPNNGNVSICAAGGGQYSPQVVSDGAGGAIITWYDARTFSYDVYVQRVNAAGVPQWTANGVAICTAAGDQYSPTIASDGAGGAIITWYDYRSGPGDIYAQRVNAAGVPQWTANGVVICAASSDQVLPTIVSDGAGGAIVAWHDFRSGSNYDVYAQRVNAAGAPQWTANGVALCTASFDQIYPTIASDGAGGAIVTWEDARNGSNYDIYAQRVNAAGVPQWTANGIALCTAASYQYLPRITADGSGGAIVTWYDIRTTTTYDVYAQRVNAAGLVLWSGDGVAVSTATNDQTSPVITSDGAGGAIIAWMDTRSGPFYDIYTQRLNAAGIPQWAANGIALCTAANGQINPTIISDGSGGAIVTWQDGRTGVNNDIYVQRVSSSGSTQWAANGIALCVAANEQNYPVIAPDGSGGAIVAWQDLRNGNDYDIEAQRIERFGYLGNPEPSISHVGDVKNDQGGSVKASWNASYVDADPTYGVYDYRVWRSAPAALATRAIRAGSFSTDPDEAARTGRYFVHPFAGQDYAWEPIGNVSADGLSSYSMVTPTTSDSVAGSNPYTPIMVEARTSTYAGYAHWFSAPDSGYSVDNLPPVAPAPFTGAYLAGATHLHWDRNTESDLAGYRLYRGGSAGFTPGPGNLVSAQPDTGYADAGPAGSYYKLSAIDIHGNESPYAVLSPSGTLDAGGGDIPRMLALAAPKPNPAQNGSMLSFTVPVAEPVTLAIYDAEGRRVRTICSGVMGPGAYELRFDLRDGGGRGLGAGLYFVRLDAAGRRMVRRLAIIE